MGNLARRLKKENLEAELAARKKDFEDVSRKYRRENRPAEKNSLKAELDELLEHIARIEQEQEIEKLKTSSKEEIITILTPYYEREKVQIQKAYRLSLPERLINKELPSSLKALISSLQLPQQEENYSFLEKFVGNLLLNQEATKVNRDKILTRIDSIPQKLKRFLLYKVFRLKLVANQDLTNELQQKLKEWAEENIENCLQLRNQLILEREQREQQCSPGLLVAISEREGSYVVEAWLIKNLAQYKQDSPSDCEQLTINQQSEIATDETLNNVPELLKNLIAQSFDKCQKYLKQIHIFLPSKFMNYAVDWWQNWQENEEQEDNYTPTIGEDYEVLLRCSERLRGKSPPVFKWREKGSNLKSKLTQPAKQIFVLRDSNNWKTLLRQLKQDERAIAATITTVFQQKQPGTILWQSAVPLALWIRQQLPQIENKSVLNELLKDCCLEEVPNQVKVKRVEAIDCEPSENHVGRHLCLLWDDPNSLPPEQLLTETNL